MAWPEQVFDIVIIFRARVGILDRQADRHASRAAFEHAGQDFDRIRLAPLSHEAGATRRAAIHERLNIGFRQWNQRGDAIDDTADGRTVAFPQLV